MRLIIAIVGVVLALFLMNKIKKSVAVGQQNVSPLLKNEKLYVFILELVSPLIVQGIFYYGWKKNLPKKSSQANNYGWLAFAIYLVVYFVFKQTIR